MRVRVLFFGKLKDIVGTREDAAELREGAQVEDLFEQYGARFPELAKFRGSVVASVNQNFAEWRSPVANGDEIAFLPPVSGGSGAAGVEKQSDIVEIVAERIRAAEIVAALKAPEDGAVTIF